MLLFMSAVLMPLLWPYSDYTDCAIYLSLLTMRTGTHMVIVLNLINSSVLLTSGSTF